MPGLTSRLLPIPRTSTTAATRPLAKAGLLLPGLLLCAAVSLAAMVLAQAEAALFGRVWLDALVLAIVLGAGIRTAWTPSAAWRPGIAFAAKTLLEVAVVLLGTSVSAAAIFAVGPALLLGIIALVAIAVCGGYGIGLMLGLPQRMAILVACGNAICGNSAIAVVAPVIGATGKEVGAAIAFTAVMGVLVVLGLPILVPVLALTEAQFGVMAGLTVYAVPQVLAATAPIGAIANQVGTLVKLVRVLMLGPVVLVLSLLAPRLRGMPEAAAGASPVARRPPLRRLVPWFIVGFLGLATLRSFEVVPQVALIPIATLASALTVLSMATLGLGVDVREMARAGGRVIAAVTLSLLLLGACSLGLIQLLDRHVSSAFMQPDLDHYLVV